jgi:hypothetical protein
MTTRRSANRSLRTMLALAALSVTAVLAPATAVASPTHATAPRLARGFSVEAVLPSDPRELVVARTAAVKPPASVTGLARDLGVDPDFAWRTLDELAQGFAHS